MLEIDGFIAKEEDGDTSEIKKLFVKYDTALRLKTLGFKKPCFGYYVGMDREVYINNVDIQPPFTPDMESKVMFRAPTYDQVLAWLRKEHNLWISVDYSTTTFKDIVITLNKRDLNDARDEEYQDYYEALEFGIGKAIERIESNKRTVDVGLETRMGEDNPVMGRNSCINKTNIYDDIPMAKEETPSIITMDGYFIRTGINSKEDLCWVVDLATKDFLVDFPTNIVTPVDSLRYFMSKDKALIYIAGLQDEDIQLRSEDSCGGIQWLNMSNQYLDSYYWNTGVFRIRPFEYEPFTEVNMDLFDRVIKSKDGKQIARITHISKDANFPYKTCSEHFKNDELFNGWLFEDGSVIGKRK